MLDNFFRINMPYGIVKNKAGEWMAFNREYMPLGYNDVEFKKRMDKNPHGLPLFTKYPKLSEKILENLACSPKSLTRDENGIINLIWFYDDATNPVSQSPDSKAMWDKYFERLKKISKLKIQM